MWYSEIRLSHRAVILVMFSTGSGGNDAVECEKGEIGGRERKQRDAARNTVGKSTRILTKNGGRRRGGCYLGGSDMHG